MAVRLADLLAGLSRVADLGFGLPSGEAVRSAVLAAVLGRSVGLPEEDVRAGLYTALLLHVGCVGYADETARLYGDELVMSAASARTNPADPRDGLKTFVPMLVRGRSPLDRVRLTFVAITRGKRHGEAYATVACEVGRDVARRLGLDEQVQRSVYHAYEWWNGRGVPDGLAGEEIPVGSRLAVVATVAVTLENVGGVELAAAGLRRQGGTVLDPELAEKFAVSVGGLVDTAADGDPHRVLLEVEPRPVVSVLDPELVDVATVFGDLADLKSPYTHGHSRGVASLASSAGWRLGLPAADVHNLELAALLHDVGRVAISSAVWDKPDRLGAHEWEQVRLHAYHSERILAGSPRLAPLARLVGLHHERSDGSGYHRGCGRSDLPMAARVLAVADAFQAMCQRRPHRAALTEDEAEQHLLDDVGCGRLDAEAVNAVLAGAGRATRTERRRPPAGITARELEVLRLVAEGCSNPQIAERLVISRRTAEDHVQNIYQKIGASSRAAAALFAMEHELLAKDP